MDFPKMQKLKARADVMKALGHPTRLFMVEELAQGELCVAELTELVGADMSTVSRHLSVLRAAGVLEDERRGNCIYYRLLCPCVLDFFACAQNVIDSAQARRSA
ncbi:winged helix-turn-helix transcriptional regulator [bacterium]|nr:winged helix-turn-helix transcriptional regulator [bacterium]